MIRKLLMVVICQFAFVQIALAEPGAKIIRMSGDVKVRRGVEESWQRASAGMLLEDIDTIWTLEAAEVVLEIHDGIIFQLGGNAILDIADLRKITEREMFLYLVAEKIGKIEPREEKTRLRIGNVSVVHGESKAERAGNTAENYESESWIQETNGAKALYNQKYYPNTIVKLHKILVKYPAIDDCGEAHVYLGKSFEALGEFGQAIDSYQAAIERSNEQACEGSNAGLWIDEAEKSIRRLNQ